ncbi:MAG TPA: hypothetical protein VGG14_06605 [Candidatus Sulfotelmatobacter sp.]
MNRIFPLGFMKTAEYIEGQQALDNFKSLATAAFQANPNPKKKPQAITRKKPKASDKD